MFEMAIRIESVRKAAVAVVRFKNGSVRILPISKGHLNGFSLVCPLTGIRKIVRYCYTDTKKRRIFMEWSNDDDPIAS